MIDLCAEASRLVAEGRHDNAERLLIRAVKTDPDNVLALASLRDICIRNRRYEIALPIARRVAAAAPDDGVQWDRLASVLMCLDRFPEAQSAVDRALELAPDIPTHWHQAALLAHRMNDTDRALKLAARATALNPYGAELKHDLAHMLLATGRDFSAALEAYEIRWETLRHLQPWDLHLPEWNGEPLEGRRILFHSEQGLGDAIMLSRLARNLVAAGASSVGLCVASELTRLFAVQSWPGVRVVDMTRIDRDDWDLQTPMFSALRWLKLTPSDIDPDPYLTTVPNIVVPPLPDGFRVGVCWASGRWNMDTGLRRIVPLRLLIELTELPGVRLISLQKGDGARDVNDIGAGCLLDDPMPACDDFAATAAVIAQLDAVVTVDTAMLHLAAAMGKPTFMLTQYTRCWRWWGLPTGKPWYGSITAAQQTDPHDWQQPVDAAREWLYRCQHDG